MLVMKFGGSSIESAKAIQRVVSVISDHADRHPAVVVSAMGKTTDRLLSIARYSATGNLQAAARELSKLRQFHLTEAAYLARAAQAIRLDNQICALFDELEQVLHEVAAQGLLTPRLADAVLSFGERLSSVIVAAALCQAGIDAVHLDARSVIITDSRHTEAAPLLIETNARIRRKVSLQRVTVLGGFIGATEDGVTTTLGRGGSDYTAALVGAALSVDEIQIWTDVDGMLTCDPRIVPDAHCLRSVSYAEAEQMAKAGAKVLHPATVLPAVRQGIPIAIRNSHNPGAPGTKVVRESPCDGTVLSIACRTGVALLQLTPRNTPVTGDFGSDIWNAFQIAGVRFELLATSRKELSVVTDSAALTPDFLNRLRALAEIEVQEDRALITLVGQNVSRNAANLARASQCLRAHRPEGPLSASKNQTPGGAILGWCSDSRFAFVLSADSLNSAAEALHSEFFGQPDPAFFIPNRAAVIVASPVTPRRSAQPSTRPAVVRVEK